MTGCRVFGEMIAVDQRADMALDQAPLLLDLRRRQPSRAGVVCAGPICGERAEVERRPPVEEGGDEMRSVDQRGLALRHRRLVAERLPLISRVTPPVVAGPAGIVIRLAGRRAHRQLGLAPDRTI